MNEHVKNVLEERIVKLQSDNDYLTRQIPFLAQRLEDMKNVLYNNLKDIDALREFLNERS